MVNNSVQISVHSIFPSVKQLIFFILKFINSWNNRCCDVKTCLCKCNSLWGFVIKDLVPINWYINICTTVKLSCNYSWRTKDRPVHEILFICALGDNMNNLTCYCTLFVGHGMLLMVTCNKQKFYGIFKIWNEVDCKTLSTS